MQKNIMHILKSIAYIILNLKHQLFVLLKIWFTENGLQT
jgi:hypothetical protein